MFSFRNRELIQIDKLYKKRLKKIHKNILYKSYSAMNCIEYLNTYIMYVRDLCLASNYLKLTDPIILSMNASIFEYNEFNTCQYKYITTEDDINAWNTGNFPTTDEEKQVFDVFLQERHQHWENYCEILKQNMQKWFENYK